MARGGRDLWMKHGALDYFECSGDDLVTTPGPDGEKPLEFTKLTDTNPDETVWFSFITFKSKSHRDEVNAKVMSDPSMNDPKWKDMPMPFATKDMAYGGFNVEVSN
jgi:uncharacterized protein YbaA (DUF1428 family)